MRCVSSWGLGEAGSLAYGGADCSDVGACSTSECRGGVGSVELVSNCLDSAGAVCVDRKGGGDWHGV